MKQRWPLIMMVVVAAMSRLIPHPWNFTAVGAMALFGGAKFESKKQSVLIPLAALVLSDLVLGFHSTVPFVYGAFISIVILGWSLRDGKSVFRLASSSLVASSLFFVISNFGVWMMGGFYSADMNGLVDCYLAALPFFDNQLFGDLFYVGLLFGSYEALKVWGSSQMFRSEQS